MSSILYASEIRRWDDVALHVNTASVLVGNCIAIVGGSTINHITEPIICKLTNPPQIANYKRLYQKLSCDYL